MTDATSDADSTAANNSGKFAQVALFLKSLSDPKILIPNLTAAVILAIMSITTEISVAALVFSGPLAPYLPTGIGMFLIGTGIGGIMVAAFSSYKGMMSGPRSGMAPIFAALVAGVAISMEGQSPDAIAVTAIVSILAASIMISFVFIAIGWARLGGLVRYIPYPVMGGFFAGLGYLLFKGGILVNLGDMVSLDDLSTFLNPAVIIHLLPALVFAAVLYVLDQRISHWLLMPAYLLATIVLFYAVLLGTGTSIETATANFWLPVISGSSASFYPVITPDQLSLVDWSAVFAQSSTILVMTMMSVIMLLLDTSGVEIVISRDIDPNKELKSTGFANIINGLCAGPICIQAAADTAFAHKLGGNRFLCVLIFGLVTLAVIAIGPSPIAYVPTLLLGGLLMYIGIDFMMTWVWYARKKLPLKDFAVICVILAVVAFYGILEGVAVGIILAIMLFVHSYSQLSVIKSSLTGSEQVSNVDRSQRKTRYLDKHGDRLHIFTLQGFLFFGTASRLLEDIRTLIEDPERKGLQYLVLDFRNVDAMDTSAANSFAKLLQLCQKFDVGLVMTGFSADIGERLGALARDNAAASETMYLFDDLDAGVAWSGDRILERLDHTDTEDGPLELLTELLGSIDAAKGVADSFEKIDVPAGETLFRQGDPGNALYLIISGTISIIIDLPDGNELHLRTMRAGAVLGEMALYTGDPRSASAQVNEDAVLLRLDQHSYDSLNAKQPKEASLFHSFIVRLMSERLGRANKAILALSR